MGADRVTLSRASASPGSAPIDAFAARLGREVTGGVLFDAFNRGRYATDASFHQIMPLGVVVPRTTEEALAALAIARDEGVPVTPRGGGTSQCGQTVNSGLVVDTSKHLNRILSLDVENRSCVVEPGIVLDDLNRQLKPHGLWFPGRRLDGLAGDDRRHGRQQLLRRPLPALRHDARQHAVHGGRALADGALLRFGPVSSDLARLNVDAQGRDLFPRSADARRARGRGGRGALPEVQRRVGGYNLDALVPNGPTNMAHVLVGSEGTLAFTTKVELKLWPVIRNRVLGVCHFGSFYEAMDAAQHLVTLVRSRSNSWTAR